MDKFDKLKLASSSLGERLKTGGAQMSRMLSTKVKEMLQAPTPESKMVDEATLETMEEPNWGLNLRICAMISSEEFNGTEVVKAIKRKLQQQGKSVVTQRLSLDLLETCTSNCDKVFSEVASEKVLEDMMRMIDDPKTDHGNRVRAMQLIRAWGESEDLKYLPVFRQTYMNLKTRIPLEVQDGNASPMQYPLESYVNQPPISPPGNYPFPEAGLQNQEHVSSIDYGGGSVEEKREFLVIARNNLDIFSSILNSEVEPKPIKDDLAVSMLENCKQSLAVIRRIIESTSDDEGMLFEALNLHDEIQKVISKYTEMEAALDSGSELPKTGDVESEATKDASDSGGGDVGRKVPSDGDVKEPHIQLPVQATSTAHGVDSSEETRSGHEADKPDFPGNNKV
nr:TOM1-like protein 2 [Ipomoea trifida]